MGSCSVVINCLTLKFMYQRPLSFSVFNFLLNLNHNLVSRLQTSFTTVKETMSLSNDLLRDILGRVDGITLANAGCVSSEFWSIARQESMWQEACCSMWPSIGDKDVKELISSSLGGFRKFYADCFPFIAYDESSERDSECNEMKKLCDAVPSDFVSLVDVQYKNKPIYSKVVWGFPAPEDFEGWFCNCPFRVDLINFWDFEDEDHSRADGLPTIVAVDEVRKDDKFWGKLIDNFQLSWILINRRTEQAANLSGWGPLVQQKHWLSDKDFVIRFGSILPAHNIWPCKVVHCVLVIKCRVSDSEHTSLKITELSMQLEDMMGAHVNGRNSLLILQRALGCRRSKDHNQILMSYKKYLTEQSKFREAKIGSEGRLNTVCVVSGIVASASFWYFILSETGAIF